MFVVLSLLMVLTVSQSGCVDNGNTKQKAFSHLSAEQNRPQLEINEKHLQLLQQSYYEGEHRAFFFNNAYNIIRGNIDIYKVHWYLRLLEILDVEPSVEHREIIANGLSNGDGIQAETPKVNKLYDIFLRIHIEKQLNGTVSQERTKEYNRILLENQGKDGLFFWENENEELVGKITATQLVLQTYDALGIRPDDLELTKNRLIQLFADDENFTDREDEMKINLVNRGVPIINSLRLLGIESSSLDQQLMGKRQDWLQFWVDQFNTFLERDGNEANMVANNHILIRLNQAGNYMGVRMTVNENYIRRLSDPNIMMGQGISDPQIIYELLSVLHVAGKDITVYRNHPYMASLANDWIYEGVISFDAKDNYYGMALAEIYGLSYNREKMLVIFPIVLQKDLTMEELFYTVRTLKVLEALEPYKKPLLNQVRKAVGQVIPKIQDVSQTGWQGGNPEDVAVIAENFFIRDICRELACGSDILSPQFNEWSMRLAQQVINQPSFDGELYFAVRTALLMDASLEKEKILNYIAGLYTDTGGYIPQIDQKTPNLYSTYRMVELRKLLGDDSYPLQADALKGFVWSLTGPHGGYFIYQPDDSERKENYKETYTLEGFYKAAYLLKMLSS